MSEVDDLRTSSDEVNIDFDEESNEEPNEEPNENSIINESENTSSIDDNKSRCIDLQLPQNVSENLDKRGRRQVLPDASLTITLGGYSFEAYVDPVGKRGLFVTTEKSNLFEKLHTRVHRAIT